MNRKILCAVKKYGEIAAEYDSRYRPLWVRKGYAASGLIANTTTKDIFIGYCLIQTVSTGLAGVEVGRQSSDSGKPITIATNDLEAFVIKATVNADWYNTEILYYAIQEKFTPVSSQFFLDQFGEINGKRYKILELVDREATKFKLILRELETQRLKTGEYITH
jgi:hypothetical protein